MTETRTLTRTPAQVYEEWMVPAIFAPLARLRLDRVQLQPGTRVLDVACGTGVVAREVARQLAGSGRVVGLDISAAMLTLAGEAADRDGLAIVWKQGGAEELPFDAASFDLVICQQGLQFVPDKTAAVAELARVLTPGGALVVSVWRGLPQNPFFAALDSAVQRRFGSAAMHLPFSCGDPELLRRLLREAGLARVTIEPLTFSATFQSPAQYIALQLTAGAAVIPALQQLDAEDKNKPRHSI